MKYGEEALHLDHSQTFRVFFFPYYYENIIIIWKLLKQGGRKDLLSLKYLYLHREVHRQQHGLTE